MMVCRSFASCAVARRAFCYHECWLAGDPIMYDKPVFLTREGRQKLEAELKWLRTERRNEVAERIRAAKEDNDITDNAEFEDAKNEQAFTEGRILEVEQILARAVLIDEHQPDHELVDRKSTRLNSSHVEISYAVFCLK